MAITIGIDIGGSTTKIVGIRDGEIITPLLVRAGDPIASLFGAFGKFVDTHGLSLSSISCVAVTGVGASYMDKPIYGLPTVRVEEFLANGLGGLHLSGLSEAVIVSMGTGTALVDANRSEIKHMGGSGIGGGTLLGLSNRMLNIRDFGLLVHEAEGGDLSKVDLLVGDITRRPMPTLPPESTASNFGKISDVVRPSDIALGILNLVFQTIGMMAIFAASSVGKQEVVLIGNLSRIPQCRELLDMLERLYPHRFHIPDHSEHGTAVGAALARIQGKNVTPIT